MPKLGETVAEGTILAWRKKPGDAVAFGDVLFEVETDKVTMEVQATSSGILAEILAPEGGTAQVGDVVAVVTDNAEELAPPAIERAGDDSPRAQPTAAAAPLPRSRPQDLQGLVASPVARRLAAQNGVDLAEVARQASARGLRRINAEEIHSFLERRAQSAPGLADGGPAAADVRIEALNRIQLASSRHLAKAWRDIPHVFQAVEVNFSLVAQARAAAKLTYLPFVARAVCLALADYPRLNATFDGERLHINPRVNLGIAVDLGGQGLVVPVVHDAGRLALAELAEAIKEQAQKARSGRLTNADLVGGTYSISNNGSFGSLMTTPIISAPQVAILSLDAVSKRPMVTTVGDQAMVLPLPAAFVGQSFDHRAIDGAYSAAFLSHLRQILQSTDWRAA